MKVYTARCHVPAQDLDIEIVALNETQARILVATKLDGIGYNVQWVTES